MNTSSLILILGALCLVAACGDEHDHSFESLPACVAAHDLLSEAQNLAHCLVDFPELHPGFATVDECVAWVTDNGGYPTSRDAACADYIEETGA